MNRLKSHHWSHHSSSLSASNRFKWRIYNRDGIPPGKGTWFFIYIFLHSSKYSINTVNEPSHNVSNVCFCVHWEQSVSQKTPENHLHTRKSRNPEVKRRLNNGTAPSLKSHQDNIPPHCCTRPTYMNLMVLYSAIWTFRRFHVLKLCIPQTQCYVLFHLSMFGELIMLSWKQIDHGIHLV